MANYKTEGIIIKRVNYAEADKILTILTKRKGKINVLAKGARKITSRKGPHLDLFNHNVFFLAEGKNFDIVTEVKPLKTFSAAKRNLETISILFYLGELIDKFLGEGETNLNIFNLFSEILDFLSSESAFKKTAILRRFELIFISELGFRPELYHCVNCRNILRKEKNVFSADSGGIVCPRCAKEGFPITPEGLKILRFLINEPFENVLKLKFGKDIDLELKNILRYYIEWILEKRLKSPRFMEEVNP